MPLLQHILGQPHRLLDILLTQKPVYSRLHDRSLHATVRATLKRGPMLTLGIAGLLLLLGIAVYATLAFSVSTHDPLVSVARLT